MALSATPGTQKDNGRVTVPGQYLDKIGMHYLTFVFTEPDGFGFVAPDVKGFTAHVETEDFDEAVAEARRVMAAHLAALFDIGGTLPEARSLADLKADPDLAEDFAEADTTIMLPALVPFGRSLRINVSIDETTLKLIDAAAAERGLTRSAFMAEAARQYA